MQLGNHKVNKNPFWTGDQLLYVWGFFFFFGVTRGDRSPTIVSKTPLLCQENHFESAFLEAGTEFKLSLPFCRRSTTHFKFRATAVSRGVVCNSSDITWQTLTKLAAKIFPTSTEVILTRSKVSGIPFVSDWLLQRRLKGKGLNKV